MLLEPYGGRAARFYKMDAMARPQLSPVPGLASDAIDFRRSLPPVPPGLDAHLKAAFAAVAHKVDLSALTHQSIPRGAEEDRAAGANLLAARFGTAPDVSRLIITNGTQSAVLVLLKRLVGNGGTFLAEQLSYAPIRLLANVAGVRVLGLDIDDQGIIPESFEAACLSAKPKVLYCNPTVQNPTTAITSEHRRLAIADIARRHGVTIIEDEALGRLHIGAPRPIAALAPDVTWYVMSTTKCLAHGLRLAYLVAPSADVADRVVGPLEHLSYWHPAPLLSAMVTAWTTSGAADQISSAIAAECASREAAARDILANAQLASKPGSMHVWLPVPPQCARAEFVRIAEARGVLLRPSDVFAVDDQPTPNAVRLSLSTPDTLEDVRKGLTIVRDILGDFR